MTLISVFFHQVVDRANFSHISFVWEKIEKKAEQDNISRLAAVVEVEQLAAVVARKSNRIIPPMSITWNSDENILVITKQVKGLQSVGS